MSNSWRPHGQACQASLSMTFLDKDTGEGCHFLLQGSSPPRDQTWVFCIVGGFFPNWTTREAHSKWSVSHWVMADSFVTPWTVAHQTPLSMGFSRQEYWSGVLFPSPGDLPNPGIKPASLLFPALAGRFFTTRATWEAHEGNRRGWFSHRFSGLMVCFHSVLLGSLCQNFTFKITDCSFIMFTTECS